MLLQEMYNNLFDRLVNLPYSLRKTFSDGLTPELGSSAINLFLISSPVLSGKLQNKQNGK